MIRQAKKIRQPKKSRPPKTLWIIDFDYALFDLYRLMDDFGALLKREFGVSESLYRQSKVDVQNKTLYSFERHIRAIQKESKLPYKAAMRRTVALLKRSQRYFFSDTMPFMRRIAKQGEVVLLSHGHTLQQRRKIKASGIEKYCDRIIITSTKAKKAEWVKKLAKHRQRVVIVNDDPEETLQMTAALADVQARAGERAGVTRVILVERPGGKYFPVPRHKSYDVVRDLRKIAPLL